MSEKDNEIENLEAEIAEAQNNYSDLEDELEVSKQESAITILETESLFKQMELLKQYSVVAYALWIGPPAGSTDIEVELHYGYVHKLVDATEDETLRELYFNFMLTYQVQLHIMSYITIFSIQF